MARVTKFDRDEANTGHIVRHAVTPEEVEQAFANHPLVVLDTQTGQTVWMQNLPAPALSGPVLTRDRVWVATAEGLRGFSLLLGQEPRLVACTPAKGRIICEGDRLACLAGANEWVVADAESGAITARLPNVAAGIPPILVDDAAVYYTTDAIQRYDLRSKQSTMWAKVTATFPGTVVTPMIMVDSHLLFATDKRGFVCMKPKKGQP